jgi:hypothetical protein
MDMLLMGNKDTSVRNVSGTAERLRLLVGIPKNAKKKYCVPIKSAVVYEGLSGHLVSLAIRWQNG